MSYGMEIFQHGQKLARERCLAKNIIGPYSCLNCKCVNFWGNDICNNCGHVWETENGRLYEDDMSVLQEGNTMYWLTFFGHYLHVEGQSYASQTQIDLFCRKDNPQDKLEAA